MWNAKGSDQKIWASFSKLFEMKMTISKQAEHSYTFLLKAKITNIREVNVQHGVTSRYMGMMLRIRRNYPVFLSLFLGVHERTKNVPTRNLGQIWITQHMIGL